MAQQEKQIQWFPGHMAKTRRLIRESLPLIDAVVELRDAASSARAAIRRSRG